MDSLESIRMRLQSGFTIPNLVLEYDSRYGWGMPYMVDGECFLEDARIAGRSNPGTPHIELARRNAQWLHFDVFMWKCSAHGYTMFHTKSGRCAHCAQPGRRSQNAARAESRTTGQSTYKDLCTVHGRSTFSTARGLCLSCYNTLGQPRPRSTNPFGFYVAQDGTIKEVDEDVNN